MDNFSINNLPDSPDRPPKLEESVRAIVSLACTGIFIEVGMYCVRASHPREMVLFFGYGIAAGCFSIAELYSARIYDNDRVD